MRRTTSLVIMTLVVMIEMIGIASAEVYESMYEGAMITNEQQSAVYLLKDGVKHHLVDSSGTNTLWWKIFNLNGKRYMLFDQPDIDKIPEGEEITLSTDINKYIKVPVAVTVNVPNTRNTYSEASSNEVISDPYSWVPTQGESCWTSGENFGKCSGRAANGFGSVVGQFARGFFSGLWNS